MERSADDRSNGGAGIRLATRGHREPCPQEHRQRALVRLGRWDPGTVRVSGVRLEQRGTVRSGVLLGCAKQGTGGEFAERARFCAGVATENALRRTTRCRHRLIVS